MKLGLGTAAALVLVALAYSAPAFAEITHSTESSFVSRHEVVVKATPKEVWLAMISPAGWWQSAHTWSGDAKNLTLTPQAGGCFCETIPEVDEPGRFTLQGSVEHMRVIQAYPEQALRMVGNLGPLQSEPVTGVLTIAISKVEKGTRIVWEYNVGGPMRYEVPVISKAVDGVMGAQLASLGKLLGVVPMPAAPAPEPAPAPSQAPAPVPTALRPVTPATETVKPAVAPKATTAPAGPAPTAKPAAAMAPVSAKPATTPAPASAKPAATLSPVTAAPSAKPATVPPKPAPKPTQKAPSVADAFGDLKDKPKP